MSADWLARERDKVAAALHAEVDAGELVIRCGKAEMRLPTTLEPLLPPSDLPEGVHRAPDGALLAKGESIPEGWERRNAPGTSGRWSGPNAGPILGAPYSDLWYEVRVVAPEPERVPVWEALRDRRAVLIDASTHLDLNQEGRTAQQQVGALACSGAIDADGTVAVLPLDGDQ